MSSPGYKCPHGGKHTDRQAHMACAIRAATEGGPPLPPEVIAVIRDLLPPVDQAGAAI